jgi:hypothetical protein
MGHSEHDVSHCFANVPAEHRVHPTSPAADPNTPAVYEQRQSSILKDPSWLLVPGGHSLFLNNVNISLMSYQCPAKTRQNSSYLELVSDWQYRPAGHTEHTSVTLSYNSACIFVMSAPLTCTLLDLSLV